MARPKKKPRPKHSCLTARPKKAASEQSKTPGCVSWAVQGILSFLCQAARFVMTTCSTAAVRLTKFCRTTPNATPSFAQSSRSPQDSLPAKEHGVLGTLLAIPMNVYARAKSLLKASRPDDSGDASRPLLSYSEETLSSGTRSPISEDALPLQLESFDKQPAIKDKMTVKAHEKTVVRKKTESAVEDSITPQSSISLSKPKPTRQHNKGKSNKNAASTQRGSVSTTRTRAKLMHPGENRTKHKFQAHHGDMAGTRQQDTTTGGPVRTSPRTLAKTSAGLTAVTETDNNMGTEQLSKLQNHKNEQEISRKSKQQKVPRQERIGPLQLKESSRKEPMHVQKSTGSQSGPSSKKALPKVPAPNITDKKLSTDTNSTSRPKNIPSHGVADKQRVDYKTSLKKSSKVDIPADKRGSKAILKLPTQRASKGDQKEPLKGKELKMPSKRAAVRQESSGNRDKLGKGAVEKHACQPASQDKEPAKEKDSKAAFKKDTVVAQKSITEKDRQGESAMRKLQARRPGPQSQKEAARHKIRKCPSDEKNTAVQSSAGDRDEHERGAAEKLPTQQPAAQDHKEPARHKKRKRPSDEKNTAAQSSMGDRDEHERGAAEKLPTQEPAAQDHKKPARHKKRKGPCHGKNAAVQSSVGDRDKHERDAAEKLPTQQPAAQDHKEPARHKKRKGPSDEKNIAAESSVGNRDEHERGAAEKLPTQQPAAQDHKEPARHKKRKGPSDEKNTAAQSSVGERDEHERGAAEKLPTQEPAAQDRKEPARRKKRKGPSHEKNAAVQSSVGDRDKHERDAAEKLPAQQPAAQDHKEPARHKKWKAPSGKEARVAHKSTNDRSNHRGGPTKKVQTHHPTRQDWTEPAEIKNAKAKDALDEHSSVEDAEKQGSGTKMSQKLKLTLQGQEEPTDDGDSKTPSNKKAITAKSLIGDRDKQAGSAMKRLQTQHLLPWAQKELEKDKESKAPSEMEDRSADCQASDKKQERGSVKESRIGQPASRAKSKGAGVAKTTENSDSKAGQKIEKQNLKPEPHKTKLRNSQDPPTIQWPQIISARIDGFGPAVTITAERAQGSPQPKAPPKKKSLLDTVHKIMEACAKMTHLLEANSTDTSSTFSQTEDLRLDIISGKAKALSSHVSNAFGKDSSNSPQHEELSSVFGTRLRDKNTGPKKMCTLVKDPAKVPQLPGSTFSWSTGASGTPPWKLNLCKPPTVQEQATQTDSRTAQSTTVSTGCSGLLASHTDHPKKPQQRDTANNDMEQTLQIDLPKGNVTSLVQLLEEKAQQKGNNKPVFPKSFFSPQGLRKDDREGLDNTRVDYNEEPLPFQHTGTSMPAESPKETLQMNLPNSSAHKVLRLGSSKDTRSLDTPVECARNPTQTDLADSPEKPLQVDVPRNVSSLVRLLEENSRQQHENKPTSPKLSSEPVSMPHPGTAGYCSTDTSDNRQPPNVENDRSWPCQWVRTARQPASPIWQKSRHSAFR
ncbi:uncharacterized protein LOC144106716 [Amblyomma americanum]